MKFVIFVAFVAVSLELALANVKFRSCGPATVKKIVVEGSDNKATPTLLRGKEYTARVEYVPVKGHKHLTTTWYGIFNGAHVKWDDITLEPGCKATNLGCPLKPGQTHVYTERFTVPVNAPAMRTVVKMKQDGDNGVENFCALLSLLIK